MKKVQGMRVVGDFGGKGSRTTRMYQPVLMTMANSRNAVRTNKRVFDTQKYHFYVIFEYEGTVYDIAIEPSDVCGSYWKYKYAFDWRGQINHDALFALYKAVKNNDVHIDTVITNSGISMTENEFCGFCRYLMYSGN